MHTYFRNIYITQNYLSNIKVEKKSIDKLINFITQQFT